MKRKYAYLVGSIFTIVLIGVAVWILYREQPLPLSTTKEWEVTVDLTAPDCLETPYGIPCGYASIKLPIGYVADPRGQLGEILSGTFSVYGGQYYTWSMIENIFENGKAYYKYDLWDADENLRDPNIPPIRQDNVGENFCFYVERIVIKPSPPPPKENGKLTVILPEGYEITNSSAQTEFVDNRWRATAYTTEYGDLFMAIYYRKV